MQGLTELQMVAHIRARLKRMAEDAELPPDDPYNNVLDVQEWVAIETINAAAGIAPTVAALTERSSADVRAALHEMRVAVDRDRAKRDKLLNSHLRKWGITAVAILLAAIAFACAAKPTTVCNPPTQSPSMETTP